MADDPLLRPDAKVITSRMRHDFNVRCAICGDEGKYYLEGHTRSFSDPVKTIPFFVCYTHARLDA